MILAKTELVPWSSCSTGIFDCYLGYWLLVELMLLLVWRMCILAVDMYGGRCFIMRYILKYSHMSKGPLFMAWS